MKKQACQYRRCLQPTRTGGGRWANRQQQSATDADSDDHESGRSADEASGEVAPPSGYLSPHVSEPTAGDPIEEAPASLPPSMAYASYAVLAPYLPAPLALPASGPKSLQMVKSHLTLNPSRPILHSRPSCHHFFRGVPFPSPLHHTASSLPPARPCLLSAPLYYTLLPSLSRPPLRSIIACRLQSTRCAIFSRTRRSTRGSTAANSI